MTGQTEWGTAWHRECGTALHMGWGMTGDITQGMAGHMAHRMAKHLHCVQIDLPGEHSAQIQKVRPKLQHCAAHFITHVACCTVCEIIPRHDARNRASSLLQQRLHSLHSSAIPEKYATQL